MNECINTSPYLFIITIATHSVAVADLKGGKCHYTVIRLPSTFHCPFQNTKICYVFTFENVNLIQYHTMICKSWSSQDPSRERIKGKKKNESLSLQVQSEHAVQR